MSSNNSNKKFIESKYPLGINNYCSWYIRNTKEQNQENEFEKINKFIYNFCLNNSFEEFTRNKYIFTIY